MSDRDIGYACVVYDMIIEADNPDLIELVAFDMAELHKRISGKPLEPIFESQAIRPSQAKSNVFGNTYQMELVV
jgi:hypothetical protein